VRGEAGTFFDLGDGQVKNNKKIDTTISSVLFTLPVPAIAPHTRTSPTVLPQRNLLRQLTWALPSGQAVADLMGVDALTPADLSDIGGVYAPYGKALEQSALHVWAGSPKVKVAARTRT
jgi:hypothetical protein